MSALECKTGAPRLCSLPPELLLVILRLATWVPKLLDPDSTLEFSPTSDRELRKFCRQSSVTKRHIIRVSKEWHSLAIPVLYETLIITRGRTLPKLRDALIKSRERAQQNSDPEQPLGWWTKRLDISMRDMVDVSKRSGRVELAYLSDIIRSLPNLRIFVTSSSSPRLPGLENFPSSLVNDLVQTSGSTLQAIYWRNSQVFLPPSGWLNNLRNCTNLRTLGCPGLADTEYSELDIPSLNNLCLQSPTKLNACHFPSLRRLVIKGWVLTEALTTDFLKYHGSRLEVMQLWVGVATWGLPAKLEAIDTLCPNLTRLDLSFPEWQSLYKVRLVIPKSVRTLGIQSVVTQTPRCDYHPLLDSLRGMKYGTSLQVIQFTDSGGFADFRGKHRRLFQRFLDVVQGFGLKAKDPDGQVLV